MPSGRNEDWAVATADFAFVLDGFDAPAGADLSDSGCRHGVVWHVRHLGSRLLHRMATGDGRRLATILSDCIEDVAELHWDTCDLTHAGGPAASVAVVRTRGRSLDYLVLGGTTVLLDDAGAVEAVVDERIDAFGRQQRAALAEYPLGTAAHSEKVQDYLGELRWHRNTSGGYWLAAADPTAARQAVTGTVPRARIRSAALLSGGAGRLVRFGLQDWPGVLDLLTAAGALALIEHVRTAERSDASGRLWPRTKAFDDATAILCRPG
ncbi:MAG: hypothetical protein ACJ73S_13235 [Mycobacteriales bacterium]